MSFPPTTATVPTLANNQMSFNGVTFAGTVLNSYYQVLKIQGLSMPPVASGDVSLPRDQGSQIGLDTFDERPITVGIVCISDGTSLDHAIEALEVAMSPTGVTEYPLYIKLPGWGSVRSVMARNRKFQWDVDTNYVAGGFALATALFMATDPRVYGTPTASTTLDADVSVGGLTFPATPPFTFGTESAATTTVANGGNFEMRPQLILTGPLTSPWVANNSITGAPEILLSNPSQVGPTIWPGDQVVIDLLTRSCLYYVGGVTSPLAIENVRSWAAGSTWWTLPANTTSTIQFGSDDSYNSGGFLQIVAPPSAYS